MDIYDDAFDVFIPRNQYLIPNILSNKKVVFRCVAHERNYYFIYSKLITDIMVIDACENHSRGCDCFDCFVYRMDKYIVNNTKGLTQLWLSDITEIYKPYVTTCFY
jgi:hypothetical protein